MPPYPEWLHILSWAYLSLSFLCAAVVIGDELRRPQKLMIMNFVWPITALYLGPAALWGYLKSGSKAAKQHRRELNHEIHADPTVLTREQVALATTHCGAGCTLGDIIADVLVYSIGIFDPQVRTEEERLGPELLSDISAVTGASSFTLDNPNDLPQIMRRMAFELRNQYVLGYEPDV